MKSVLSAKSACCMATICYDTSQQPSFLRKHAHITHGDACGADLDAARKESTNSHM